jgi:hypothetical protein
MLRGIALIVGFVLLPTVLAGEPKWKTAYKVELTVREGLVLGTGPTRTIRLRTVAKEQFIRTLDDPMWCHWIDRNDRRYFVLVRSHENEQGNEQLQFRVLEATIGPDPKWGISEILRTRTGASAPVSLTDPIRVETTVEGKPLWIEVCMREAK